jgi:hypothetical protein
MPGCVTPGSVTLLRAFVVFMALASTTAWPAPPAATFEFQHMFGQFGFFQGGRPPTGFSQPTGVSFTPEGRLIIADRENSKLQSCSVQGDDCFWMGGGAPSGLRNTPGTFDRPHGVEVSPSGKIAVADEENHAVQLCNALGQDCVYRGVTLSTSNPPGSGLGRWAFPHDVAIDSMGQVFGLDTDNNRIQVLRESDLQVRKVFMTSGSGLGQVDGPQGLAMLADDRVVIADTGNHRIQICDIQASCTAFGAMGTGAGQFMGPVGVEVDPLGRIWVADTGNHRVQVCTESGECLAFGGFGTGEGQFDTPSDVAVHPSGQVAVVDTNNNRIQVFSTEGQVNDEPRDPLLRAALERAAARIAQSLPQGSSGQEAGACKDPSCKAAAGDTPDAVRSSDAAEMETPADTSAHSIPSLNTPGQLLLILLLGLGFLVARLPRG